MATFSLKLKTEEVAIETKEGTEVTYTICEMVGRHMTEYLDESKNNVLMADGKVVGMKSFDGLYAKLLERTVKDSEGELILRPMIDLWPSSMQKGMFEIAQRLNGLGAEDNQGNG